MGFEGKTDQADFADWAFPEKKTLNRGEGVEDMEFLGVLKK